MNQKRTKYLIFTFILLIFEVGCIANENEKRNESDTIVDNQPNALYLIVKHDKYGFIDLNGNIIIEPAYDKAIEFSEGLALIQNPIGENSGLYYGFINSTGTKISEPIFAKAYPFSEGLAAIYLEEKYKGKKNGLYGFGFIDYNGKYVLNLNRLKNLPVVELHSFSEGFASFVVQTDDSFEGAKWGLVDKNGKVVLDPIYDSISYFKDEMLLVIKDGQCGFINKKLETVIDFKYDDAIDFSEGLSFVISGQNKYYINKKDEVVINLPKNTIFGFGFSDGIALVKCSVTIKGSGSQSEVVERYGYINNKGVFIIPPKYIKAESFSEKYANVYDGTWHYIDKSGIIKLSPKIKDSIFFPFKNGLAMYKIDNPSLGETKIGYINKSGKIVWDATN